METPHVEKIQNVEKKKDQVYKMVPEAENIILTLVENLTNNELFQKHVNKLHESALPKDKKKSLIINKTIQNIKVFNTKINPLFLATDIGVLVGISQINYVIKKFEPEEKVEGYITINNKIKKVIFLTKHGIYRCFFASRSPLARLFRKFICNLIDHMVENESEMMAKISAKFQKENKELLQKGIQDLQNKLVDIETKYIEEQKKTQMLAIQYDDEYKKRIEIEEENIEIDILNSYNTMHIEQLKKEKQACMSRINDIKNNIIEEDNNSIETIELRILKEKYMKPMYIYILTPTYFKKLLKIKKKELSVILDEPNETKSQLNRSSFTNDFNEPNETKSQLATVDDLIDDTIYEHNFTNIFAKNEICIDPDEILYYCLGFGRNISSKDKIITINTQWVANKKHFTNILKSLDEMSTVVTLNKIILYKTSIEEINDVNREEFINLSLELKSVYTTHLK
jgi:prophage antirepressor-like protein